MHVEDHCRAILAVLRNGRQAKSTTSAQRRVAKYRRRRTDPETPASLELIGSPTG
jgi:hypothetical protein